MEISYVINYLLFFLLLQVVIIFNLIVLVLFSYQRQNLKNQYSFKYKLFRLILIN